MLLLRRSHSTQRSFPRKITVNGSRTSILDSPGDYLSSILNLISSAQDDITLSALYFGTGEPERRIIAEIQRALSDKARPNLTCTYILDYSRTTRIPAKGNQESGMQIFQPLLEAFGDRMRVLLYRMPQNFGFLNPYVPGQISEILGVYHCKFCLFDGNVILTGANLSAEYLTNRQDRYIVVEQGTSMNSSEKLSPTDLPHFLRSFVKIVEPHCFKLTHDTSKVRIDDGNNLIITEPVTQNLLTSSLGTELTSLLHSTSSISEPTAALSESLAATSLRPIIQHSQFDVLSESQHLLRLLFASQPKSLLTCDDLLLSKGQKIELPNSESDQRLGPSFEDLNLNIACPAMSLGVGSAGNSIGSCDENVPWNRIVISSPYPSYLPLFASSLLSISASKSSSNLSRNSFIVEDVNVIADDIASEVGVGNRTRTALPKQHGDVSNHMDKALGGNIDGIRTEEVEKEEVSPNSSSMKFIVPEDRSHGFQNGGGLKKLIPKMHSYAFQSVLLQSQKKLNEGGEGGLSACAELSDLYGNVSICPYYREDWTFHVKGIWVFSPSLPHLRPPLLRPIPHSTIPVSTLAPLPLHPTPASNTTNPDTSTTEPILPVTANPAISSKLRPSSTPIAATYIGSSNFGERSCFRDFELGFVLHTNCTSLAAQLSEECSRIEERSSDLSEGFTAYTARTKQCEWYIPYLTKLLRTFL